MGKKMLGVADELEEDETFEESVVRDAQEKWQRCYDWEQASRQVALEDYKFANGDSENNYQWPGDVLTAMGGPESDKPILTINKVRQNCLQITNDAKKNKPSMKFRPVGNGATAQSAQIWNGISRHIEAQSLAQACYDNATSFMVQMGFGFWIVKCEYVSAASFDQEIYIRQVKNPWSVLLDMDAKEPDRSDAKFGFITEDVPQELFAKKYPKFKELPSELSLEGGTEWVTKDHIRVCEFYRQEMTPDTLYAYFMENSPEPMMVYKSEMPKEILERVEADGKTRKRDVLRANVKWYFIVGDKLVEKRDYPGKYIPIVQISGEETIIDNVFDRRGHVRNLKDPQRMYNYFSSSAVEYGALQTKTPWLAPAEAIEDHEKDWNESNIQNKSVLLYNSLSEDGKPIAAPVRNQPPIAAPLCIEGMRIASDEITVASGQYAATMGAPGNERSAKAIGERQRQADTSTYHFVDALAIGVRYTAKIIKDLAPHIYDTPRILQIIQEDGKTIEVQIDPGAQKAYQEVQQENSEALQRIFNPSVGDYEVIADVGPDWGTKRQEAFTALSQLLGQAPQMIPILGDLLLRSGDFPMSEIAAERLYRMLPPQAKGEGPTPQEQAMQQRISALQESIVTLLQDKSKLDLELKGKDQAKLIDAFNAVTARLKVIGDQAMDAGELKALVQDTLREALGIDVTPAADASEPALSSMGQARLPLEFQQPPKQQGVKFGADGQAYGRDFAAMSNYRRV